MARRYLAAGLVALCIVAGMAAVLALRAPAHDVVLNATPIGNPILMQSGVAVDSRLDRAFILDDGVRAQHVTVSISNSGWYSYSSSSGTLSNKVHALVTAVKGYNPATLDARVAVLDTRTGALLRTLPLPAGQLGYGIYAMAVDTGSGHLVTTYDTMSSGTPDRYSWIPRWLRARLPWVPPPPPPLGPNQRIITHTALTLDPS